MLQAYFPAADKRITVRASDGFAGLKSVLPPLSRRGLALIDPSYEDKGDYGKVVETMRDALTRFATGIYAVWYPMVRRGESQHLADELQQLTGGDWLHVPLRFATPPPDGFGLYGSGMFVFNPHWKLEATLREVMPVLASALGQDGHGTFKLQFRQT